jgi:DNA-binding NarL/FixJ family response regulator
MVARRTRRALALEARARRCSVPLSEERERIYRAVTPDRARVLHFLPRRDSRREIATEMGFATSTVRNHIEHMEEVTELDQGQLRDFWLECEAEFLRWHLEIMEPEPEELIQ